MRGQRRPRAPRPLEKVVQQHAISLLRSVGGQVNVLGTRRKRGDYQGTRQTPGIPDLYVFLPTPRWPTHPALGAPAGVALWFEVKRPGEGRSPDQVAFGNECHARQVPYVWGDLDALIHWLTEGGWLKRDGMPHYRQPAPPAKED